MSHAPVRLSLLLSFAQRYSALILRAGSMVVLARLIPPAEHGIAATAAAVIAFGLVLTDIGTRQYLINVPEMTAAAQRAALGLGLSMAAPVAALTLAATVLLPGDWMSADLRHAVAVLTLMLLIEPVNAVGRAGLEREMRFGAHYWVGTAGVAAMVAVAVGLALAGYGYRALVWGAVADSAASLAVLQFLRPAPRPSARGWRAMLRFGWAWAAIQVVQRAGESLRNVALGAVLGFGAVGLLSRAYTVVLMFDRALIDAVWPVLLPTVAARQRAGLPLGPVYLRQVSYLAAVSWPFFGAVALLAEPLVLLLLGPDWLAAVPVVRILAIGSLLLPLTELLPPYFIAAGALERYLPVEIRAQAVATALFVLGSFVSFELACAALAVRAVVHAALAQPRLRRQLGFAWGDLAGALGRSLPPALACVAAAGVAAAVVAGRWGAHPLAVLPAATAAGGLAWAVALVLVRHPLLDEVARMRPALGAARLRLRAVRQRIGVFR